MKKIDWNCKITLPRQKLLAHTVFWILMGLVGYGASSGAAELWGFNFCTLAFIPGVLLTLLYLLLLANDMIILSSADRGE
jgi:hypothetical protein